LNLADMSPFGLALLLLFAAHAKCR
jgi:hypothetical protein